MGLKTLVIPCFANFDFGVSMVLYFITTYDVEILLKSPGLWQVIRFNKYVLWIFAICAYAGKTIL